MKKIFLSIILSSSVFAMSSLQTIAAEESSPQYYAGIGYALGTYDEEGFEEFNPNAIGGRLGMQINDNFSVEGRLAVGIEDDSINVTIPPPVDTDVKITGELDILAGIYGVGHINVGESFSVYGLIGYTYAEWSFKASAPGISSVSDSGDDAGLSIGFGAELDVSDDIALNLEYVQYLDESDYDMTAIAIGAVYNF